MSEVHMLISEGLEAGCSIQVIAEELSRQFQLNANESIDLVRQFIRSNEEQ